MDGQIVFAIGSIRNTPAKNETVYAGVWPTSVMFRHFSTVEVNEK